MIDLIADSIDDLEDTTQVIDYLKREDGLNSLIYNLTEEDLEVPAIKQTAENILSDYNIPQNIDNMTALKSIIRKTLKSDPNNEKVNQFLESTIKTIFNDIDSKIGGVSEVKRVISSELPPEEFLQWLGEEATSLGIYWSYGSGFAYDADTNHPYRYTFVTNINKEDVDILRTELASLRFNKNEEEIRLKQGVPITLTQVLDSNGNELPLTPEITGKTFYSSETKKEGSRMLHIEKIASSEDLELSRGEIGVSLEDYDPSKDKEKSTKNRWSEKPNQNTAVKPALTQESDNYKKDKLDKAKYTNFLGRTDQDKPVRVMDFATPGQYVGLDDYFTKHTDTLQDDQQQYDTRNFGRGKMQPKQYSNFLYKSELLHIEQGITKEADLNSKKPYLLKDLENSNVDKKEYDNIIQLCNKADPTDNKAVYTQWILKQYLNNNFKGEEDVEKFRDTLNKFTKLKNSKKIDQADLNQYKSYGELAEKVNGILEESGGYTSKREEEITKAEEGIRKIDQDGDIELFVVNTPEAAAKEFRNTEWCVKDPKWFNDDRYGGTDRNFYYFKKDGNPYLLLHKNDFRKTNDDEPDNQDLKEVSKLMVKHYLPHQYDLLNDKIITREDGELFNQAVNNAIKDIGSFYVLVNKIITKEDEELFNQAVNNVIEEGRSSDLLSEKIISREDGELFNQAVNNVIEKGYGYDLLRDKIINREDGDLFYKILKNEVDGLTDSEVKVSNTSNIYDALKNKYITKEDSELFDKAVSGLVRRGQYGDKLILEEIITKEDGDLFTSVYNKAIEEDFYGMFCYDLLTYTNIANDDPELYDKAMEHVFVDPAFLLMNHRTIKKDNDLYNNLVEAVIEEGDKDTIESLHTYNKISDDVYFRFLKNQEDQQSEEQSQPNNQKQQTQEQPEVEEQQDNINKTQLLHIITLNKIAAESQDSSGTTSITPTVTDKVTESVTQKPVTPVTQGKGGKPTKGSKAGGTGTRPVKAFYLTNLNSIDIIADQFGDGVTRTELPESSVRRFRQEEANDRNKKEQDITRKKMKGKQNKPLHNVPKKDVYAWGNDDLMGGAVFYSDMSIPQMGDLSEMN